MEINRNQYLFIAIFLMLIGLQLRMVSQYVLTPEATRFIAERTGAAGGATAALPASLPGKVVSPPEWLGWCLISVGAVLFFHSMAMKKPGG